VTESEREREAKEGRPSPPPERRENRTKRGGEKSRGAKKSRGGLIRRDKPRREEGERESV
jgi:hypothetical protein